MRLEKNVKIIQHAPASQKQKFDRCHFSFLCFQLLGVSVPHKAMVYELLKAINNHELRLFLESARNPANLENLMLQLLGNRGKRSK